MQNQPGSGIRHTDAQDSSEHRQHHGLQQRLAHQAAREAPSATRIEVCARSFNPRANIRFAKFAQATSSTHPAAISSSFSPS